jgi:hypothetical protein
MTADPANGHLRDLNHPGIDNGWKFNNPHLADFVPFPIIHPSGKVLDTTYIKYDLSPNPPQLLGSHAKGLPIHSQPLRPKRADHMVDPFTNLQKRLFDPTEPFRDWVMEACEVEGDQTLTAGVNQYMYLKRLTNSLSAQIQTLLSQLSTNSSAAIEALHDLENADAYRRLVMQIDWLDRPNIDGYMSQAGKAYQEVIAHDRNWGRMGSPPPSPLPIPHTRCRCYRCRKFSHIVRDCPEQRKFKPLKCTKVHKGKGKKATYWKDL